MQTIGAYEAKTHLAEILDRVARGEKVRISRRGTPVADVIPIRDAEPDPVFVAAEIRRIRKGVVLGGLDLQTMIEEGRL